MELTVRFTREEVEKKLVGFVIQRWGEAPEGYRYEAILNSYGSGGEVRTVKDEEMIDAVAGKEGSDEAA